jgi:hypothetical protein
MAEPFMVADSRTMRAGRALVKDRVTGPIPVSRATVRRLAVRMPWRSRAHAGREVPACLSEAAADRETDQAGAQKDRRPSQDWRHRRAITPPDARGPVEEFRADISWW